MSSWEYYRSVTTVYSAVIDYAYVFMVKSTTRPVKIIKIEFIHEIERRNNNYEIIRIYKK